MDGGQFRLFTKESLGRCQQQALAAVELAKQKVGKDDDKDEDKPQPNSGLETGKPLPKNYGDFPRELYGKPIEELDEFYAAQNVRRSIKLSIPRDAMLARICCRRMSVCLSVRPSARPSVTAGTVPKRLNVGSRKQHRTMAQGL